LKPTVLTPEVPMPTPLHASTIAPPSDRGPAGPSDRNILRLAAVTVLVIMGLVAAVLAIAVR
jgi:hypothetical protein